MSEAPRLERGLGLLEATSLNMIEMVGIGPFIVIPFVIRAMHGPQALVAWGAGGVLALFDGCVWAELGAAMPEAGGSYVFLREAYGPRWGRLMSFLYIWQTLFQAPLVIASGALGFAGYFFFFAGKVGRAAEWVRWLGPHADGVIAAVVIAAVVGMLYRKITAVGKISVAFWVIVVGTIAWLIAGGIGRVGSSGLFDSSSGAWDWSVLLYAGLGHATVQTVYCYLGYYNVCNLGGEMKSPEKNIPRAIFISIAGILLLYLAMQASILSVVPWQQAQNTVAIVSAFVERAYGSQWASLATVLILVVALGSLFSATLGYSRVPYAAAVDGNFFSIFGRLHPKKHFPHVSLLALGATAILFSLLFNLFVVIRAILAMRCLIQFIGQSVGLMVLRRRRGSAAMPFRMWLYPLPVFIAIAGWAGIFISTGRRPMIASLGATFIGALVYLVRASHLQQWPFKEAAE
ncbi:MAG TPA: APC family permease [Candidatus Acidoferrum sp.]|nr:APC family permease [Candidatus Acidoferrum sp.]